MAAARRRRPVGGLAAAVSATCALVGAQGRRVERQRQRPALLKLPVELRGQLVVANVRLGDGHTLASLVDTGSGNLVVPSSHCEAVGCQDHERFRPEMDEDGRFLGGEASDVHLSFSGAHLSGSGFEGTVCLGGRAACGHAAFVVAGWLSDSFQRLHFDAILGLGPPRQAVAPRFNLLGQLVEQGVLSRPAFKLSLRREGESFVLLGGGGEEAAVAAGGATAGSNATTAGSGSVAWLPADSAHGEWAVRLQSLTIAGKDVLMCSAPQAACRAVIDSGCPGLSLPAASFQSLRQLLPPLKDCSKSSLTSLPRLQFAFGDGHHFEVSGEDYVELLPNDASRCLYNIQAAEETVARTVTLGVPFLLGRDVVFDQGRMRLGVADSAAAPVAPAGAGPRPPLPEAATAALASLDRFLQKRRRA